MKRELCLLLMLAMLAPTAVFARSAFSPRHSGLEAPDERGHSVGVPGRPLSRTPMGGMGYTDAYGNGLDDQPAPEKPARKRLRPGAMQRVEKRPPAILPDPDRADAAPLWKFH